MPNTIGSPANPNYDFGEDFSYAVWTEGTQVVLCNVPWNSDYRDIVRFANGTALDVYINSLESTSVVITTVSYIKPSNPVVRINIPFNSAYKYNYLRVVNPLQPVSPDDTPKYYYYFITDVRYLAPNTTELVVQLDVWQTWGYEIEFGNCYVDSGHIGIANTNAMSDFGRSYLAIPEGFDTGSEYRTIHVEKPEHDLWQPADAVALIVSTVDLAANAGTVANPVLTTANGGTYFGIPCGASIYAITAGNLPQLMGILGATPWVSQGIISITIIPKFKTYFPQWVDNWQAPNLSTLSEAPSVQPTGGREYTALANWRTDDSITSAIPARYAGLLKFYTAPYMMIELTTFSGTGIFIRPENWNHPHAALRELFNFFPPDQRVVIWPLSYNTSVASDGDLDGSGDEGGSFVDTSTMVGDFPQVPVVNNMAINYLAANKNQISYQYSNADWSQQRALFGNQISYDQSSSGMNAATQLAGNANRQSSNQTAIANQFAWGQNAIGAAGDLGMAAATGGMGAGAAVSGVAGVAGTAMQNAQRNEQTHAGNVGRANATRISNANTGYIRDTNKQYGDWAAKGDYSNAIAGINAKVQDSKLTEPSMSGQLSGSTFNFINYLMGPALRWKFIDPVAVRVIGEYWLRYGYAVRTFLKPPANMMVMTKFTYWKMQQCYIIGSTVPEWVKQATRGIFEKGVTVWADPTYIGTIDNADNDPLGGISF